MSYTSEPQVIRQIKFKLNKTNGAIAANKRRVNELVLAKGMLKKNGAFLLSVARKRLKLNQDYKKQLIKELANAYAILGK